MSKSAIKSCVRDFCTKLLLDSSINKDDIPFINDISSLDMTQVVLIVDSMIKIRSFSNRIPIKTTIVECENSELADIIDEEDLENMTEQERISLNYRPATFRDLVNHIFREEIFAFIKGCKICVATIDDSGHVPRSKEPEQNKRKQYIKDIPYEELTDINDPTKKVWDGVSPILTYSEQIVPDWKSICASRKARRRAIQDVIQYVKNGNLKIASGRKLYIDYGGDKGFEGQPMCLERDGRKMIWSFESKLTNYVGEGEKMIIFYADYFARLGYNILSSSRDTDSMMLWLHYMSDIMSDDYDKIVGLSPETVETIRMLRSRVYIHRFGTVKNPFFKPLGKRPAEDSGGEIVTVYAGKNESEIAKIQDYCCMNKLYSILKNHTASMTIGKRPIKYPVLNFCSVMVMAGSDYVEGIKGISHETFFNAFINHADYIGDIFKIENGYPGIHECFTNDGNVLGVIDINIDALYRCLSAAVITTHRYRTRLMKPTKTTKDAHPDTYKPILHSINFSDIVQVVKESNVKRTEWHLRYNYENYFGRVWWNIIYDMIAYKYKPPDCTIGFGWKEDENKHIVIIEDVDKKE